ncbi:hypothetical protein [Deinococcus radiotolerans]|uniref:DUF4352 domain-containing protein n=1 Tax=Deinococcus radiotolerans TaxID=1309407 RepID=A0ABQ2FRP2_9DEIO|nr:hypothetical protein [Deinococcus radiotolerans]GGL19667.1 hypothetical protein GCM10010844_43320 [Deinococcus radiotolerans]
MTTASRLTLLSLALLLPFGPAGCVAAAQTPVLQGTVPLAGVAAVPGKPYTIGRSAPLNFTLLKAEFSVSRVIIGTEVVTPQADQKLLVLTFRVANPQKKDAFFNAQSLTITAVDAGNTNRPALRSVGRAGTRESASLQLKPSQALDFVTVIVVPARGPVPKLIVERETGTGVLRYDLRQVTARLTPPYADPADPSGASALSAVPALPNRKYPLERFDLTLETVAFSDEVLDGRAPRSGYRYVVATVLLNNMAPADSYLGRNTLTAEILDADGERLPAVTVLKARSEGGPNLQVAPSADYRARYVFEVPSRSPLQAVTFQEGRAHTLHFDLSTLN